ncbi:MAG: gliding motility-associated ABC transporter substrate-binding protein GldG [Flavobacteriales bacterium]
MKTKRNDILRSIMLLAIVLLSAYLLSIYFFKLDLTAEKRHSLAEPTIAMLQNMEDNMFVRCYLHGDFPAEYKHLEQSIRERLDEFRDYSGGQIEYEFIDPYESGNKKIIGETGAALLEKGLRYTTIPIAEDGAQGSKAIWPGAIIQYRNKEYAVQFLKSEMPVTDQAMVANSVNNLEFELASAVRKITRNKKPAIAVLQGHRELDALHMADFMFGLRDNYDIEFMRIDSQVNAFSDKLEGMTNRVNRYDALIVAGPDSVVNDKDRVIIDQFIMNGGRMLWLLDALHMDMDSLEIMDAMAVSNENGLYEMLYEYGVRLNRTVVMDFQGVPIVLVDGQQGNQPQYVTRTNYYAPLVFSPKKAHPIISNLDPVRFEFVGSLDTVNSNADVRKIPFLFSSPLSKELRAPTRVSLESLRFDENYFKSGNKPNQMLGIIMEGKFPSAFKDVLPPSIKNSPEIAYRDKSNETKMIVIADADVAYNDVALRDGKPTPRPLGYESGANRVVYDNKEFLLNCMNYLLDDQALITVRSRSIELRALDLALINANRTSIKLQNVLIPLLMVVVFGFAQWLLRRKKWLSPA